MDKKVTFLLLAENVYENTSYTVPPLWQKGTQSPNYFQTNYILHFHLCQQFAEFSHFANEIFGAMHTYPTHFLYILLTRPRSRFSSL